MRHRYVDRLFDPKPERDLPDVICSSPSIFSNSLRKKPEPKLDGSALVSPVRFRSPRIVVRKNIRARHSNRIGQLLYHGLKALRSAILRRRVAQAVSKKSAVQLMRGKVRQLKTRAQKSCETPSLRHDSTSLPAVLLRLQNAGSCEKAPFGGR